MTRLPEWHSTWWWEPLNYSYIIGKYEHAQKIYRTQRNLILSTSTDCSNASYLSCKRVVDLSCHIGYMYLWKKWKNKTKSTTTSFITYLIEINFYNSEYINGIYMYTLIKRVWICSTNFLLMNFKQCWKYCFFKLFIIKLSLGLKET